MTTSNPGPDIPDNKSEEDNIKFLDNLMKDIPDAIQPLEIMNNPNELIPVYEGTFILKSETKQYECEGKIYFAWSPSVEVRLSAHLQFDQHFIREHQASVLFDVVVKTETIGKATTTYFTTQGNDGLFIKAVLKQDCILGDITIPVTKICFEIPNLREFIGVSVKRGHSVNKGRLLFETNSYIISLDRVADFKEREEKLISDGGYILTYTGQLIKKAGNIEYKEAMEVLASLHFLLSFINGSRTSALFIKGYANDVLQWQNYPGQRADPYKPVLSWSVLTDSSGFNQLWNTIVEKRSSTENRDCVETSIHWYLESNKVAGYAEGSMVLAQNALELLYNWIIVESKKIILGEDAKNISASNKIRLLLHELKISPSIPSTLPASLIYANQNKYDGPEIIVQIRNAIVHSQLEKRKKLRAIPGIVIAETLHLAIFYQEIVLLKVLDYKGKYIDRIQRANIR